MRNITQELECALIYQHRVHVRVASLARGTGHYRHNNDAAAAWGQAAADGKGSGNVGTFCRIENIQPRLKREDEKMTHTHRSRRLPLHRRPTQYTAKACRTPEPYTRYTVSFRSPLFPTVPIISYDDVEVLRPLSSGHRCPVSYDRRCSLEISPGRRVSEPPQNARVSEKNYRKGHIACASVCAGQKINNSETFLRSGLLRVPQEPRWP